VSAARRGALLIAGAALLWSTGGVGIKVIAAPPLKIACWRSAFASLALLLFFRPRFRATPGFLAALVCYASCLTTFVVATKWTTAANAIFLQYSGVVWVMLLAPVTLGEPFRARDALAVVAAFAGMGLFFVGKLEARGHAGDVVGLLSGVFFAGLVLFLRRERGSVSEGAVTWGSVLTALVLAPFVAGDPGLTPRAAIVLVLLGTVQIALAYVLFLRGIEHVPATQASLISMLEPVANPIWVFLILGESPGVFAILGGAVVLGAVAWHTLGAPPPLPVAVAPPD
jgi:drug/metabolite transporter, DME family